MNYFKKVVRNLSLSNSRKVRGYEIKRMPIGAYIVAMEKLQNFPAEAMEAMFPGMDADAILKQLKTIDTALLGQLAMRAFTALPKHASALISALTGIPEDKVLNDPNIGLDGLIEITGAWIEVNGIENFFKAARDLMEKVKTQAAGSKGSSPQASQSESPNVSS
jgi:hypothetical protein